MQSSTATTLIVGCLLWGNTIVRAEVTVRIESEAESTLNIFSGDRVLAAKAWLGRASIEFEGGKRETFDLVSIRHSGSNLMWWDILLPVSKTATEALTKFKQLFRCAERDDAIMCVTISGHFLLARACSDKVSASNAKKFITRRLGELGSSAIYWATSEKSFATITTQSFPGFRSFYDDNAFRDGPPPAIEIQNLYRAAAEGIGVKLRREDGKTATVILSKELKATSGQID